MLKIFKKIGANLMEGLALCSEPYVASMRAFTAEDEE